jgi:hypothetical protein
MHVYSKSWEKVEKEWVIGNKQTEGSDFKIDLIENCACM